MLLSSIVQARIGGRTWELPLCARVHIPREPPAVETSCKGRIQSIMRAMTRREPQRRRLVDVLLRIPKQFRSYLKNPRRRALWGGIAILSGFYVALRVSISYGALPVNDWLAAAVFFLFTELVTWYNYSRPVATFPVSMLNNFKLGFTYGLCIGALKL